MRVPSLLLYSSLALLLPACSGDVDAASNEAAPAPAESELSHTDQLAVRAIQLLDAATQVINEATEHSTVENASLTLKSLGVELNEVREELAKEQMKLETHPNYGDAWMDAVGRLENAVSLMTAQNPKTASTITAVMRGLQLGG